MQIHGVDVWDMACCLEEAAIAELGQEDLTGWDGRFLDTTVDRVRGDDCEAWASAVEFWRDRPYC